jgi:protein TonB
MTRVRPRLGGRIIQFKHQKVPIERTLLLSYGIRWIATGANAWYIHPAVWRSIFIGVIALTGVCNAVQTPAVQASISLHQSLGGACEVSQPATLVNHGKYVAVVLGSGEEIFSPELTKDDKLFIPDDLDNSFLRLARKSGFRVQQQKEALETSPQVIATDSKAQCPTTAEALTSAARNRKERMRKKQSKLRSTGVDGVTAPTVVDSPLLSQAGSGSNAYSWGKGKYKGTVGLAAVVGIDGSVPEVKVVRSASGELDKKAIEAVKKWKFSPATMNGLPVPVLINIEVNFQLY